MSDPRETSPVLRALLLAWPPGFRERHGEDLARLYVEYYGRHPPFRFWLEVAADAVSEGFGARIESFASDLRIALRGLRRSPAFAVALVLTLALGIGANSAVFSLVNAILLRPLPYASGERLIHLSQVSARQGGSNAGFSPLEVKDYREQAQTLDAVVEYHSMPFTILGTDVPSRVQTGVVSPAFFESFGIRPAMGRAFIESDDDPGAAAVLVVSNGFWRRKMGADPGAIGRTFTMNDKVHTVVGVLPELPQYPDENDVYMPVSACPFRSAEQWKDHRDSRGLNVFGRLKAGIPLARARADLDAISSRLHAQYPGDYPASGKFAVDAVMLRDELTRSARPTLVVLLATSAFLLLIVCANVANLMLARVLRREREISVRTALGASRGRLFQQSFAEALLLCVAGGVLGLLVASHSLDALTAFAARFTSRAREVDLDWRVVFFTLAVSTGTAVLLAALPAAPARLDLMSGLKDGAGATQGRASLRLRAALVVAQVAISFALLAGAGLMLRSLWKLSQVPPGFDVQNVLTARTDLNWSKYPKPESRVRFVREMVDLLRPQPGVTSVAMASAIPLTGGRPFNSIFQIEGREARPDEPSPTFDLRAVSPGYFETLGVSLVHGRLFFETDVPPSNEVALVNQTMARRYWPAGDAIGHRITQDAGKTYVTIVGVVSDVKDYGLDKEPVGVLYSPLAFSPFRDLRVLVRGRGDPAVLEKQVREAVRSVDPQQPLTDVHTLEQVRHESLGGARLTALLLGLFSALALAITAAGIGGVLAFSVSQRRREIGVRMALGATAREVLQLVMGQGLKLVSAGLLLGAIGAIAVSHLMKGLLYGVRAVDPFTFVGVAAVLFGAGALACFIPARRATLVDPMEALRSA